MVSVDTVNGQYVLDLAGALFKVKDTLSGGHPHIAIVAQPYYLHEAVPVGATSEENCSGNKESDQDSLWRFLQSQ